VRQWLYDTLTAFANDVSLRLGNKMSDIALWSSEQAEKIEQWRKDCVAYINNLMLAAPWPFDQALVWFWSLCNNYIVTPAFNATRNVFVYVTLLIVSYYEWNRMMYTPQKWLRDILYNIRDRFINVIDDTANLLSALQAWTVSLDNMVRAYFQPLIDALNSWRKDLNKWLYDNVTHPITEIINDITEIGAWMTRIDQDVRLILNDPVYWIWAHIEPYLREKVTEWLNAIWYERI
jgi:hypothetical protein